jgi:hypothetical protein
LSLIEHIASRAAIAAGGAQEAVAWKVDGLNGYNESAPSVWLKKDNAEAAAAWLFKSSITPLAGPLPRVAATVAEGFALVPVVMTAAMINAWGRWQSRQFR